jgi:mannose-6-phosphate isomerase-like protein (cupin superfamily)
MTHLRWAGPKPRAVCAPIGALALALAVLLCPLTARAGDDDVDAIVAAAVRANYEPVHACYRKVLARERDKGGTVFVRVTLGPHDAVGAAKVEKDELKDPEATACIAGWVRGWTLRGARAAGAGPGAEILIPLTFRGAPSQFAVREEDAPTIPLSETASARVLLSASSSGARQASLVVLETQGALALPGKQGTDQALYVLSGRGHLDTLARDGGSGLARGGTSFALGAGTSVWLPADARASLRGDLHLLQFFVPAGLEADYAPGRRQVTGAKAQLPVVVQAREARTFRLDPAAASRVTPLLHTQRMVHGRFYLGLLDAPAGSVVREHVHADQAELIYVIAGQARTTVTHTTEEVSPGHGLYIPAGARHTMHVIKNLRVVQLYAPAGPEQRFLDRGSPGLTR